MVDAAANVRLARENATSPCGDEVASERCWRGQASRPASSATACGRVLDLVLDVLRRERGLVRDVLGGELGLRRDAGRAGRDLVLDVLGAVDDLVLHVAHAGGRLVDDLAATVLATIGVGEVGRHGAGTGADQQPEQPAGPRRRASLGVEVVETVVGLVQRRAEAVEPVGQRGVEIVETATDAAELAQDRPAVGADRLGGPVADLVDLLVESLREAFECHGGPFRRVACDARGKSDRNPAPSRPPARPPLRSGRTRPDDPSAARMVVTR